MSKPSDKYLERIYELAHIHPKYGHPIVSSLLLFWLLGTMHGWEWTYERNIFLTTA